MNLNPEDPRLSSYLLGELSPDEAAEVERAVAADPALRVALEELGETQRILGDSLGGEQHQLHGWQREAVHRAARDAEDAGKLIDLPSRRRSLRPVAILAAAAAVIFVIGWAMWKFPIPGDDKLGKGPVAPDWSDPKVEIALLPMPGPEVARGSGEGAVGAPRAELIRAQQEALRDDPQGFLEQIGSTLHSAPLPPAGRLPAPVERKPVDAAETPLQPLPLIAGELSYHWLRSALLDDGRLPPPAAVRVGELVNAFRYRLSDPLEVGGVRFAAESGSCPWDESARLVLITIECVSDDPRQVAAAFEADPGVVRSYRLLGFGGSTGRAVASAARKLTTIPAGHRVNLMLQLWPSGSGEESPGEVSLRVLRGGAEEEHRLPIEAGSRWDECSGDFRHAALVAGSGLWMSGSEVEPRPAPGLLAKLAEAGESAAAGQDERRAEGLQLIIRAAALAAE